jgi:hypothetical protein
MYQSLPPVFHTHISFIYGKCHLIFLTHIFVKQITYHSLCNISSVYCKERKFLNKFIVFSLQTVMTLTYSSTNTSSGRISTLFWSLSHSHTHTHTHIYTYIYIHTHTHRHNCRINVYSRLVLKWIVRFKRSVGMLPSEPQPSTIWIDITWYCREAWYVDTNEK